MHNSHKSDAADRRDALADRADRHCSDEPGQGIRLLIQWDIDHTLIHHGGVSRNAFAAAFEDVVGHEIRHPVVSNGRTDPETIADLLLEHGITPTQHRVSQMMVALAARFRSSACDLNTRGRILPGAQRALSALEGIPGVVQTVVTGNIRLNAMTKLIAFGLDRYIDFDVGGYGSDMVSRPELVSISRSRAATKYRFTDATCTTVIVGDTPRDVNAGRESGAHVVAVASGRYTQAELLQASAEVTLPSLRDTERFVGAIRRFSERDPRPTRSDHDLGLPY